MASAMEVLSFHCERGLGRNALGLSNQCVRGVLAAKFATAKEIEVKFAKTKEIFV